MRRYAWLGALTIYACSTSPSEPYFFSQPTRVRVSPAAFLGDTPCSTDGGMHRYQATLFDVTDGLDAAVALPSSDVVPCTADVEFEYVEAGRFYIAEVRGFDRSDLNVKVPGAPLVFDESETLVAPRWETTCWGQDGVTRDDLGLGGASASAMGGFGGNSAELGVRAFSKTIVTVRGCEALSEGGGKGDTLVSLTPDDALVDVTCGNDVGQVANFRLALGTETEPLSSGGAGGSGGADAGGPGTVVACGSPLLVEAVPGSIASYDVEGLDASGNVIWETSCQASPREGITVSATCDPARPL